MDKGGTQYMVRAAYHNEWSMAMELAWKTFLKFEAPEYPPEGVRSFHDFITDDMLHKMYLMGSYQMFAAFDKDRMIGMITMRDEGHISLLFVDENYHRKGVGRSLMQCLENYLLSEMGINKITVNASPYGEGFYRRLGFESTDVKMQKDGIIYTPMELIL